VRYEDGESQRHTKTIYESNCVCLYVCLCVCVCVCVCERGGERDRGKCVCGCVRLLIESSMGGMCVRA
jgi:hypothetical protein